MILFSVTSGRLPDFYDSQESWFRSLFQSLPDVRFTLRLASAEYVQSALSYHLPHIGASFVVLIPRGQSVPAVMRRCLPHCHRVYPCGGTPPYNRPGASACWLFHPSTRCQHTRFHSGKTQLPAGMVPEFRPERHLFPQCEAVLGFTQTCQKRSVPMSFRDRGHAQLHPLVAGFRPLRICLSRSSRCRVCLRVKFRKRSVALCPYSHPLAQHLRG